LGGQDPEPSSDPAAGTPDQGAASDLSQHPIVQSRFGGDVQAALDAYGQLDREYGQQGQRMGQRISELESTLSQLQEQTTVGDPEPTQQGDGGWQLPDVTVDQLQEWFDNDPAQATAYLVAQGQQMILDQINQTIDQRLKPVESQVGRTTATSLMDGLKKAVGEDAVARNASTLLAMQKDDPAYFQGDPAVVFKRMKMAVLAADAENGVQRGASNGAATPAPADVAVMGGSQGRNPSADDQPLSPGDEFKQALLDLQGEERDAFGNPRRAKSA